MLVSMCLFKTNNYWFYLLFIDLKPSLVGVMSFKRKTDKAILQELGERIKAYRMQANYTQKQLAEKASISAYTLQKLEYGESANLSTFIQVLRALGQIDQLAELLQPAVQISPLDLLKEEKPKQRVRNNK